MITVTNSSDLLDIDRHLIELVRQWCHCLEYEQSQKIVREIAIYTECLDNEVPDNLSEEQRRQVLKWVNENHHYAYLVASGQLKL